MNETYGKIFPGMYEGSMAGAGLHVFALWPFILSNRDRNGQIEINPKIVAFKLGGLTEDITKALDYLMAPDHESRTPDHDGRRLLKVDGNPYLYQVVNHLKYRALASREQKAESDRNWDRQNRPSGWQREKAKRDQSSQSGSSPVQSSIVRCSPPSPPHTDTDTEEYTDTEREYTERLSLNPPKSTQEIVDYCSTCLCYPITLEQAQDMSDYYAPPGGDGVWRDKTGTTLSDWRRGAVSFRANQRLKSTRPGTIPDDITPEEFLKAMKEQGL